MDDPIVLVSHETGNRYDFHDRGDAVSTFACGGYDWYEPGEKVKNASGQRAADTPKAPESK